MIAKIFEKNKKTLFVFFLFFIPVLILFYDELGFPKLNLGDEVKEHIALPVAENIKSGRSGFSIVWGKYISLVNVHDKNLSLEKVNKDLKNEIELLKEMGEENIRLKGLLNLTQREKHLYIPAQIIGYHFEAGQFTFTVNQGRKHQVQEGMGVLGADGVVGTVSKVYGAYSEVLALLDPGFVIDGRLRKERTRFLVSGFGESLLSELKFLKRQVNIRVGDQVITSGMGSSFPKGLVIGTVVEVRRKAFGVEQKVKIRPSSDFNSIEEVLLIKSFKEELPDEES